MELPTPLREWNVDRRVMAIAVVVLLVLLGTGVAGFLPNDGPDDEPNGSPAPSSTATETPTPTPEAGGQEVSLGDDTEPPDTETATPTPSDDDSSSSDRSTDPPETPTPTDGPNGGGSDPTPTPDDGLVVVDGGPLLDVAGVLPGSSGTGSGTVGNNGTENGTLYVSGVSLEDHENGITEPESEVDDSPEEGELSGHLQVRVILESESGEEESVLGTADGFENLSVMPDRPPSEAVPIDAGEEVNVIVQWILPESTSNVVQSDGVTFDVNVTMEAT